MLSKVSLQIEVYLDIEMTEEDDDVVGESKPTSTSATSAAKATSPINPREQRASGTSDSPRPVIQKRVPLVTQYPAPPHLRFISQYYAFENLAFFEDYVWQAPGGEGVDLFVVDTGANQMYVRFVQSLVTCHEPRAKRSTLDLKLLQERRLHENAS